MYLDRTDSTVTNIKGILDIINEVCCDIKETLNSADLNVYFYSLQFCWRDVYTPLWVFRLYTMAACSLIPTGYLLGLVTRTWTESISFFRNVGKFLPLYTASPQWGPQIPRILFGLHVDFKTQATETTNDYTVHTSSEPRPTSSHVSGALSRG
jgi:hypothetical protein